jgi:hypothetical protein
VKQGNQLVGASERGHCVLADSLHHTVELALDFPIVGGLPQAHNKGFHDDHGLLF